MQYLDARPEIRKISLLHNDKKIRGKNTYEKNLIPKQI